MAGKRSKKLARELLRCRWRHIAKRSWTASETPLGRRAEVADTRRFLDPGGRTGSVSAGAAGAQRGGDSVRRGRRLRDLRAHRDLSSDQGSRSVRRAIARRARGARPARRRVRDAARGSALAREGVLRRSLRRPDLWDGERRRLHRRRLAPARPPRRSRGRARPDRARRGTALAPALHQRAAPS